jgi:hypothetical protein
MFPNRVPMDRDTPSPEPLVYSFIHSFMYVWWSPQNGALLHIYREKKVTVHGAPHRWKAYMQWGAAWFPKGIRGVYSDNQWHRWGPHEPRSGYRILKFVAGPGLNFILLTGCSIVRDWGISSLTRWLLTGYKMPIWLVFSLAVINGIE